LGFAISIIILQARFIKLKRINESENWYSHGRTGQIDCAGLAVDSPVAVGGFGGINAPNKAPSPKNYKSVQFYQIFKCQSPLHKRKAPLLKTFWRRFSTYVPFALCTVSSNHA